jgi:GT2 family glycosyltransferase
MRRSAYQQVGGYDAGIFMYAEDVELSYRFRSYGYALKYVPKATVQHFTYESAGQIKPLQFVGSAIGNVYIRLRYGKALDRCLGMVLYSALLLKPAPFTGAKSLLLQRGGALLRQLPHFLRGKGKAQAYFPLVGFDYEMIREGAFWEIPPPLLGNTAPLVSIITRTYRGRGVFLAQAMQSVFNQTYSNIEWLVVEDGGATQQALVMELAASAPIGCRVQFIACEKLGRSGAGNKALAATTGRFVMFLDDDDLLFADHVETLMTVLQRDPMLSAAYALAFEVLTDIQADYTAYRETSFYTPDIFKQAWDYEVLVDHNFIPIQAILFKRELYEERGGFDVSLDQLEDWNLWMRYGYGKQFAYVPKTTSLFRSPADFETRSSRHALLHDAYNLAKNKAVASLQGMAC